MISGFGYGKKIQQLQSVQETDSNKLYRNACTIIEQAQREAYRQVNGMLIKRNWLLGMRIQHDVIKDKPAEYGLQVVKNLSKSLTDPNIFYALSRKSEIVPLLTAKVL